MKQPATVGEYVEYVMRHCPQMAVTAVFGHPAPGPISQVYFQHVARFSKEWLRDMADQLNAQGLGGSLCAVFFHEPSGEADAVILPHAKVIHERLLHAYDAFVVADIESYLTIL
jgi:hypothetical protein